MSSTAVEAPLNPAPHPDARRVWLVSTPIDPRSIPADLVGVDASGLKAAMRNRGLETEHWALKIDSAPGQKTDPTIVDITVQADHKMVSQLHPTSSPYWSGITRRMAVGWTIWNDHEVLVASKQLISARPKYDGRGNNFMQLARMLARHIEFVPVAVQGAGETDAAGTVGTDAGGEGLLMPGNRSQMTLVSGGTQSQRSQSLESSDAKNDLKAVRENNAVPARIPASSRQSQRMSIARPPLIQLSTAPSEVGSMLAPRPALHRAAESEGLTPSPAGSVRMSLPPQSRQQTSFSSPLNPQRQSIGDLRVDTNSLRARTNSDAANAYATTRIRASRRRSEAPSEWTSDVAADQRFRSVGSRSSLHPANRDSMLSLNTNFISSPSMWLPPPPPPPHTASHLPMMPFHPQLSMPGFPSMMFTPQQMFYPPPHPQMPLLVPPSPGFASHTSSAVNTPPESPALVGKGLMAMPHELRSNLA
ncbi:hypothetical protein PHSY_006387 [Pseudozyma hubeiensis SY62]|uniref:Uncharacterized protein n=1 Tax=Pseudozyma hubeiensis (strain SY62) TaxID=1305764 RepID=R9PC44_PSEHS|nr:hypothetical protein PHSY_006387 [Pseudozyma hubeiensis SY62]GAC98792.1 hypothetical protein PHSY_006387 [Pseudozyma hubeiensis SY62]